MPRTHHTGGAIEKVPMGIIGAFDVHRKQISPSAQTKAARYGRYWVVTGVSAGIQISLLFVLTTVGVPYLLSNLIGIGAATTWNFKANNAWTWSSPPASIASDRLSKESVTATCLLKLQMH